MTAAERIAVMEGELEGIDLVEVLQVVGIGRQYTGVELRKADQSPLGIVFIKAGKVVSAVAGERAGVEAFFELFASVAAEPRKFFHVFRMETPRDLPEPIGSLGGLVLEALERARASGPRETSSGVMPRPRIVSSGSEQSQGAASERRPPQPALSQPRPRPASAPAPTPPVASTTNRPAMRSGTAGEVVARQTKPAPARLRRPSRSPAGQVGSASGSSTHSHGKDDGASRIVLGVVSPKGGAGKTTIALNLALSLAQQGRSVILVDGDINGDVLSSIAARGRARHGALDVLTGQVEAKAALLATVLPQLRILPATGEQLPDLATLSSNHSRAWQQLLEQLSQEVEIVVVDCPAGMFGGTRELLGGFTHVLGVLQAELIASRSFITLRRALEMLPVGQRPEVAGVLLNMLQPRHGASVQVLADACAQLPPGWLLDTAIPRSNAFLDASEHGVPLRLLDEHNPPAVSWLFDTLASEIGARVGLATTVPQPRSLLPD